VASHQDYLNGIGPRLGYPGTGIRTTDDNGKLSPVVRQIIELVAQHDAMPAALPPTRTTWSRGSSRVADA
jgi:hypothetical protein